jgi:hypothetical protein
LAVFVRDWLSRDLCLVFADVQVSVDIKQSFSPMFLPGRIYHMVPVKMPKRCVLCVFDIDCTCLAISCCTGSRRRFVIYPARQKTFQVRFLKRFVRTSFVLLVAAGDRHEPFHVHRSHAKQLHYARDRSSIATLDRDN